MEETIIPIDLIEAPILSQDDGSELDRFMELFLKNELSPIKVCYDFGHLRVIDDRDERIKWAAARKCGARVVKVIITND